MDNRLDILMQDTALRKAFGARVKELRKALGWSQKQLATQLDIRFQLLVISQNPTVRSSVFQPNSYRRQLFKPDANLVNRIFL